jgi:arabinogalactan endo-1,4-beta-galactosidase
VYASLIKIMKNQDFIIISKGCIHETIIYTQKYSTTACWPDGRSSNMSKFAELVNAGIDGVKDVSEDIEIMPRPSL